MIRVYWSTGLLSTALAACSMVGSNDNILALAPIADPLVDNLFIGKAKSSVATTAPLGGGVGTFAIRGRCLVVDTGDMVHTPVFRDDGVKIGQQAFLAFGKTIAYGKPVSLPMATAGLEVQLPENSSCPRNALWIRDIQP